MKCSKAKKTWSARKVWSPHKVYRYKFLVIMNLDTLKFALNNMNNHWLSTYNKNPDWLIMQSRDEKTVNNQN